MITPVNRAAVVVDVAIATVVGATGVIGARAAVVVDAAVVVGARAASIVDAHNIGSTVLIWRKRVNPVRLTQRRRIKALVSVQCPRAV